MNSKVLTGATVGVLSASIVFYTISGIMIAMSPNHNQESSDYANLSPQSKKLKESEPSVLSSIQMAARIMPSQNAEYNKQKMIFSTDADPMASLYAEGIEDDVTTERFTMDQWDTYFPSLVFNKEYVPMGTSKPYCLHFDWIRKDQASQLDKYLGVQNVPYCSGATAKKQRWDLNYPKIGLDFNLFKQTSKETTSADQCDPDSIFQAKKSGGGYCYSYQVLDAICVRAAFVTSAETATYSWQFVDGCFENGAYAHYITAKPDTTYVWNKFPIQIRQTYTLPYGTVLNIKDEDDQIDASASTTISSSGLSEKSSSISFASIFAILGHVFLFATFICVALILYEMFSTKGRKDNKASELVEDKNNDSMNDDDQ